MNKAIILFLLLGAAGVYGQNTNAPTDSRPTLESEAARRARANPPVIQLFKANEITVGKLTYDGIVIEVIKTHQPLQLINPAAPPEYGSATDNLVRDPINGRVSGLKLFSFKF